MYCQIFFYFSTIKNKANIPRSKISPKPVAGGIWATPKPEPQMIHRVFHNDVQNSMKSY